MNTPAITILMPVYNGEKYLREAIDSVLNQTFTDFEFLIINDGSTDKSEEIIFGYKDSRIRYVKNEANLKLIATLNKGIGLAKGKYIARMDADDISLPERLQTQFDFMERNIDIALCGSWFKVFGDKNETVKYVGTHNEIMMKMLYQCHFCHPSIIMRKSMIESFAIKFDQHFLHAEDYDFFVRIGERFELANIQEVLVKYRIHEESVSQKHNDIQYKNSTIIKQKLFKKIGLDVSEKELDFFKTIMQHEYVQTEEYILKASSFLEKLFATNERSSFFEKEFLKNNLGRLWFNVTYNSTCLGSISIYKYRASVLSSFNRLNFFEWLRFYAKALFKI